MTNALHIERVNNGWIVREYDPFRLTTGCCGVSSPTNVYTSVEALSADLPRLLGVTPQSPIVPTSNPS